MCVCVISLSLARADVYKCVCVCDDASIELHLFIPALIKVKCDSDMTLNFFCIFPLCHSRTSFGYLSPFLRPEESLKSNQRYTFSCFQCELT